VFCFVLFVLFCFVLFDLHHSIVMVTPTVHWGFVNRIASLRMREALLLNAFVCNRVSSETKLLVRIRLHRRQDFCAPERTYAPQTIKFEFWWVVYPIDQMKSIQYLLIKSFINFINSSESCLFTSWIRWFIKLPLASPKYVCLPHCTYTNESCGTCQ